jgi:hypothetical protein
MTDRTEVMVDLTQLSLEPSWVSSMREHHNHTGAYRRADVIRLLGAPWDRVEIALSADGAAASCVKE